MTRKTKNKVHIVPQDYMAVWEGMLELRDSIPRLDAAWHAQGTAVMRDIAESITGPCVAAYDAAKFSDSFDWEFVPLYLQQIESFDPLILPQEVKL